MTVKIPPDNTDDRAALRDIERGLKRKFYVDKGYIGKKIFKELWGKRLQLITGIRRNMKKYLMPYFDKAMLRKRFIIETIFGILKTEMNLEHSGESYVLLYMF